MESTGILLANLGSPDAPTPAALRRYLGEFLWDRRVVDLPRLLWWPILHGVILRTRPARSAALYRKVWTEEGAPLIAMARRQRERLEARLAARGLAVPVALGMRYGSPSIGAGLRELRARGVARILVLPLYPQNSCSTTGSTFDAVARELASWRAVPELRFLSDYHQLPGYLDALANSVRDAWSQQPAGQMLIISFHGTPERFRSEGDVYYGQCQTTAAGLAARLGLGADRWRVVFQSRFGREEWLKPYADATLAALPAEGITRVDVVCPGFSADCLETLEEMGVENRRLFLASGGETYRYIPALNERADHIDALATHVQAQLG
jgi:ferrochelatase